MISGRCTEGVSSRYKTFVVRVCRRASLLPTDSKWIIPIFIMSILSGARSAAHKIYSIRLHDV